MKKKMLVIVLLILVSLSGASQNIISSFMGEIDKSAQKGAMQINISGKILRMAANKDSTIDAETKKLFQDIDKIGVVAGLPIDEKRQQQLQQHLSHYEELISVVEDGQNVYMYTKDGKGYIEEFVLYIISNNSATLMSITGKIDLEQIAKLSKEVKLQGIEHLDKINNNPKKIKK